MIKLGLFVLFHEKVGQTIECIKSFSNEEITINILNNGSSQASLNRLETFCKNYPNVRIFTSEKNLGVGVGRNYLINHSDEEWMLFVDNDIVMSTHDWYSKILAHIRNNPEIEIFVPKLFNIHENSYCTWSGPWKLFRNKIVYYPLGKDRLTNVFPGGASFINRKIFDRIGLYDDQIFVGLEDFEYTIRSIKTGNPARVLIIEDIELIHDHRFIIQEGDRDAVKVRYSEDALDNSYKRIIEKYPGLKFSHDWKPWVNAQVKKLLKPEISIPNLSLFNNFGTGLPARQEVNYLNDRALSLDFKEIIDGFVDFNVDELRSKKVLIISNENIEYEKYFLTQGLSSVTCNHIKGNSGLVYDFSDFNSINTLIDSGFTAEYSIVIVDRIFEKLSDVRPMIRLLKVFLSLDPLRRAVTINYDRFKRNHGSNAELISNSKSNLNPDSYREWTLTEMTTLLLSSGFVVDSSASLSYGKSDCRMSLSGHVISFDSVYYGNYLKDLGLPDQSIKHLVYSAEQALARQSGGIGAYVEENKVLSFNKFFDNKTIDSYDQNILIYDSFLTIISLYLSLKIIEYQDIAGIESLLDQGRISGSIPSNILLKCQSHESGIKVENASRNFPGNDNRVKESMNIRTKIKSLFIRVNEKLSDQKVYQHIKNQPVVRKVLMKMMNKLS